MVEKYIWYEMQCTRWKLEIYLCTSMSRIKIFNYTWIFAVLRLEIGIIN